MTYVEDEKTQATIYKTKNYDKFYFIESNRVVTSRHVNELANSIKIKNDLHVNPIKVDENLRVIDGQHRLGAAKLLNVPIFYVIVKDYDEHTLVRWNDTQKKWAATDYSHHYAALGNENYIKFEHWRKKYCFPISTLLTWVGIESGRDLKRFRAGKFICPDLTVVCNTLDTIKIMKDIQRLRKWQPNTLFSTRLAHKMLRIFLSSEHVDVEYFLEQLNRTPLTIYPRLDAVGTISQYLDVYNYGRHEKNRIKLQTTGLDIQIVK